MRWMIRGVSGNDLSAMPSGTCWMTSTPARVAPSSPSSGLRQRYSTTRGSPQSQTSGHSVSQTSSRLHLPTRRVSNAKWVCLEWRGDVSRRCALTSPLASMWRMIITSGPGGIRPHTDPGHFLFWCRVLVCRGSFLASLTAGFPRGVCFTDDSIPRLELRSQMR